MTASTRLIGDPLKQLVLIEQNDSKHASTDFTSLVGFKNVPAEPESFEELVTSLKYDKVPSYEDNDLLDVESNEADCIWDQSFECDSLLTQDSQ